MVNASAEWSLMLWNELENWENGNSLSWRISFFNCIPDEYINSFYCIRLFDTIQSIDRFTFLYIERYSKFNIEDKHITKSILKLVAEKNEQQNFVIAYSDKIFKTNLELFEDDYKLIKISYFQQYRINHSQIFDYKGEGFYNIYRLHPKFLKDFVSQHYCNYSLSQSNKKINLNFLWNSDRNNDRIEESLNIVIEKNHYLGIGEHPIKIFFENINVEQQKYAIVFIKDYLVKNSKNARKLNVIFDGIRHYLSPHFEELLLYYLANNPQLEIFQKIDWVGNVGVQVGDVNFGELYIKRWENILVIINKSKDSLAMIPLRAFLKKKIAEYFKRAEHEREMNFLKPDG